MKIILQLNFKTILFIFVVSSFFACATQSEVQKYTCTVNSGDNRECYEYISGDKTGFEAFCQSFSTNSLNTDTAGCPTSTFKSKCTELSKTTSGKDYKVTLFQLKADSTAEGACTTLLRGKYSAN